MSATWLASPLSRRRAHGHSTLVGLVVALLLAGCATGKPSYMPVKSGVDPYSGLRERAEEYYQSGLSYERAADWRNALRSYEQAMVWDPDGRTNIRARVDYAREMVGTLDPNAAAPTPTFRSVQRAGGSVNQSPASPAVAPARTPTATPTATVTRRASPTSVRAGYRSYQSKGLRYTISFPASWTVKEGAISDDETRSDTFTGTVAGSGVASVVVTATTLPRELSSEQYYLQIVGELRQEQGFLELPSRQIAATTAYLVTHSSTSGGKTYSATHAILAVGKVGWLITLIAEPTSVADARAIFDVVLGSFAPEGEVN